MRVRAFVQGDIDAALAAEVRSGERAVSQSMRAAQAELKANWRGEVTSAGLGQRLANTIRGEAYPRGTDSLNAAALVWTRAPKIIGSFEKGGMIRGKNGLYLAIPLPAAGIGAKGRKMTPEQWELRNGMKLRFVFRAGKPPLLVADDARLTTGRRSGLARRKGGKRRSDGILAGAQTIAIFLLVRQARLTKRLNLMAAADAIGARLPQKIISNWPEV